MACHPAFRVRQIRPVCAKTDLSWDRGMLCGRWHKESRSCGGSCVLAGFGEGVARHFAAAGAGVDQRRVLATNGTKVGWRVRTAAKVFSMHGYCNQRARK